MIDAPAAPHPASAAVPVPTPPDPLITDTRLASRIHSLATQDGEYWAFKSSTTERRMQRLFQYPAMTVPELQRELIRAVQEVAPARRAYDPFLGAGTTLVEAMGQGLAFAGQDINPLAILVAQVKAGPFHDESFRAAVVESALRARSLTTNTAHEAEQRIGRWYTPSIAQALIRLQAAVRSISDKATRKFLWVALAETARRTSHASPTSFKLHRRVRAGIERTCAISMFEATGLRNAATLAEQREYLEERGFLSNGRYTRTIRVRLGDTRKDGTACAGLSDLLLTSPPYGDNQSTVAYGQYSYLPLQWIDGADIDPGWDPSLLRTTQEIDRQSLGGRPRTVTAHDFPARERSPALGGILDRLRLAPPDRAQRVAAFFRDLDDTIDPILSQLAAGSYMFWTLGNRTVGGQEVPMDQVVGEFLTERGCRAVTSFVRSIPIKRLASRNSMTQTMRTETILVLRAPGGASSGR